MKIKQVFEEEKPIDKLCEDAIIEHWNSVHEEIFEVAYKGNIGIMELSAFYQKANEQQKQLLQKLIADKDTDAVWELVYKVTGMRIMR